jgi:hypothetical protein
MAKIQAGRWEYDQAELKDQVHKATERGRRAATSPQAVRASYEKPTKRIVVELNNGGVFSFPYELLRELRGATPAQLARVELSPQGTAIHWDALDAQYSVTGLLAGIFGTAAWMSEIGRKGGASTSTAKSDAARRNGKKGGRPALMQKPARS